MLTCEIAPGWYHFQMGVQRARGTAADQAKRKSRGMKYLSRGMSCLAVAKKLRSSREAVRKWKNELASSQPVVQPKRRGKSNPGPEIRRLLLEFFKEGSPMRPRFSKSSQIAKYLNTHLARPLSLKSIQRHLRVLWNSPPALARLRQVDMSDAAWHEWSKARGRFTVRDGLILWAGVRQIEPAPDSQDGDQRLHLMWLTPCSERGEGTLTAPYYRFTQGPLPFCFSEVSPLWKHSVKILVVTDSRLYPEYPAFCRRLSDALSAWVGYQGRDSAIEVLDLAHPPPNGSK